MAELRSYQWRAISQVLEKFEVCNSVMLQMPTGTGKTVVFTEFVRRWLDMQGKGKRVLFIVHRTELVDQIIRHLSSLGIPSHRIQGAVDRNKLDQFRVHVGTVQTLNNPQNLPQNLSLIVIDEAHHTPALSYRKIIDAYSKNRNLKILGVTATPRRLSGESFEDLFEELILSDSIKQFQEQGYLAKTRHFVTSLPNLKSVKLLMQDYDERQAEQLMLSHDVMADLIESYQNYAQNKKAIIFAVSIKHSKKIVERFAEKHIRAAHIDGTTPSHERAEIVKRFKEGKIQILSNVNVFTEGFDCPDVEVVQLARPTKSLVLYLQMVGRVMRPFEGKEYGLILDNARLWEDHGLSNQIFHWNLKGNDLNPDKGKLAALTKSGESNSKINANEVKGLELVEIVDAFNQGAEIENTQVVPVSKEVEVSLYVPARNALIMFSRGNSEITFDKKLEQLSIRIDPRLNFGFAVDVKSYTKFAFGVSTRKHVFENTTQTPNYADYFKALVQILCRMNYTYAFSKNLRKSTKHDFIFSIGNLELKLSGVPNSFFVAKSNYDRIKLLSKIALETDFSFLRPSINTQLLSEIHPQFGELVKYLFFASHPHDLELKN